VITATPPAYRARPAFPQPVDHAADANAAVLSLYKLKMDRYIAYTNTARVTLTTALLGSIGEDNVTHLKALFLPAPHYSLAPRQIVDAMLAKHGQTTGPDLKLLRAPLLAPLQALAELEAHMNRFMLASLKLSATGHGKFPYRYFEIMFLDTVQGFPIVEPS
jgi:hypothetical protein